MAVTVINRSERVALNASAWHKVRRIAVVEGDEMPTFAEWSAWLATNPNAWERESLVKVGRVLFYAEAAGSAATAAAKRAREIARAANS